MNSFYVRSAFTHVRHQRRSSRPDQKMNSLYVTSVSKHVLHQRRSFYVTSACTHALYQRKGSQARTKKVQLSCDWCVVTHGRHQRSGSKHDQKMNSFYVTRTCTHGLHQRRGSMHNQKMNSFYVKGAFTHALRPESEQLLCQVFYTCSEQENGFQTRPDNEQCLCHRCFYTCSSPGRRSSRHDPKMNNFMSHVLLHMFFTKKEFQARPENDQLLCYKCLYTWLALEGGFQARPEN